MHRVLPVLEIPVTRFLQQALVSVAEIPVRDHGGLRDAGVGGERKIHDALLFGTLSNGSARHGEFASDNVDGLLKNGSVVRGRLQMHRRRVFGDGVPQMQRVVLRGKQGIGRVVVVVGDAVSVAVCIGIEVRADRPRKRDRRRQCQQRILRRNLHAALAGGNADRHDFETDAFGRGVPLDVILVAFPYLDLHAQARVTGLRAELAVERVGPGLREARAEDLLASGLHEITVLREHPIELLLRSTLHTHDFKDVSRRNLQMCLRRRCVARALRERMRQRHERRERETHECWQPAGTKRVHGGITADR